MTTVDAPTTSNPIAPTLVLERAAATPDRVALRVLESGVWVEYGWADVARTVARVADVLRRGGVEAGTEVVVVSGSRAEWLLCVWAIQALDAVATVVSAQVEPATVDLLAARKPMLWILEGLEACDRVARTDTNGSPVLILDPVGSAWTRTRPWVWQEDVLDRGDVDDAAVLAALATSAGTVDPSSVALRLPDDGDRVLSHRDLVAAARCVQLEPDDEYLTFLPPTWEAEAAVLAGAYPVTGATLSVGSRVASGVNELAAVRPTAIQAPAEWWDGLAGRVLRATAEPGPLARGAVRDITSGDPGGGLLTRLARSSITRRTGLSRVRTARSFGTPRPETTTVLTGLGVSLGVALERPSALAGDTVEPGAERPSDTAKVEETR